MKPFYLSVYGTFIRGCFKNLYAQLVSHHKSYCSGIKRFFGRNITTDPGEYDKSRQDNIEKLKSKHATDLKNHNEKRNKIKDYEPGQIVFIKQNTRLGSKLSPRYKKETVKENRHTTIITETGRIVHKSNIKQE